MIEVVLFDLDGTLSDPTHRRHWIKSKPTNWRAFNEGCINDPPLPTLKIFKAMFQSWTDVYILSGRENTVREQSLDWLMKHGGFRPNDRNYISSRLYMRAAKDYRPDEIIKAEFLEDIKAEYIKNNEEYKIIGVFDDRNKVVDMWRSQGLFVFDCNQTREEF